MNSVLFQMPRTWKRTTERGKWTEEHLKLAIWFIEEGNSIRAASKQFNIPFTTLRDRKFNKTVGNPKLGRGTVFSKDEEKLLTERIRLMANLFYGLTPLEVRRVAYEYAEQNNISNTFSKERRLAGKDWLEGFLKRNPHSIRKPEATSINRVTGFNRDEVANFFSNLEQVMSKEKFPPDCIYNMDETGVTTVQDPGKIVAEKGKKRVGSVTSWERGKIILQFVQ